MSTAGPPKAANILKREFRKSSDFQVLYSISITISTAAVFL